MVVPVFFFADQDEWATKPFREALDAEAWSGGVMSRKSTSVPVTWEDL